MGNTYLRRMLIFNILLNQSQHERLLKDRFFEVVQSNNNWVKFRAVS